MPAGYFDTQEHVSDRRWFILLQMYGSLNSKIPKEAADCCFVTETLYEGSSTSFRTFIFSRETVRAGGVVIGRV